MEEVTAQAFHQQSKFVYQSPDNMPSQSGSAHWYFISFSAVDCCLNTEIAMAIKA
jgi:hypothetical protein